MAAHVLMHHNGIKKERYMPEPAVRHWQKVGWKLGGLPKAKQKKSDDEPVPERQEGDA